jgi:hypothetical protein
VTTWHVISSSRSGYWHLASQRDLLHTVCGVTFAADDVTPLSYGERPRQVDCRRCKDTKAYRDAVAERSRS